MSPGVICSLAGLLLVGAGERWLGAAPGLPRLVSGAGVLLALAGLVLGLWRWRQARRGSAGMAAASTALVAGQLLMLLVALAPLVAPELLRAGSAPALWWSLALAVAVVPVVAIERAVYRGGPRVAPARIEAVAASALAATLAVAAAVPLNLIATRTNVGVDLRHFKTTEVGEATAAIVAQLDTPVQVRIWQRPTSDVTPELRAYFDALAGPQLRVEVVDHAAFPDLARELQVPGNGWVSFTLERPPDAPDDPNAAGEGEASGPVTDKISIGEDLDRARKQLRKLDEQVQSSLRQLGRGPRIAYLVQGHGELTYAGDPPEDRKITGLRSVMRFLGFRVKLVDEVGWLGKGVPADASLVLVLGPDGPYYQDEVDALRAYLVEGGALLVALEPAIGRLRPRLVPGSTDPLEGLLGDLGVRLGPGVVASEVATQPLFHSKLDRSNILTNRYAVHPATETLMGTKPSDPLLLLQSGWLESWPETEPRDTALPARRTDLVRTLDVTWGDLDGRLDFDAETEQRRSLPVAAAITGEPRPGVSYRALILADSGLLSDAALRSRANAQFAADALLWLVGAESLAGAVASEEDVKIEHSKEGQGLWFYGTTLLVPALLLGLGLLRLWRRRRGSTGGGR